MTGQELARDRIRGCMIGGAVGDALGWPVEFQGERQIFDHYGSGGIRAYDLDAAGVAEITDDTQMALFTANALLVGETRERLHGDDRLPRQFAAIAYQDWLITQNGAKGEKRPPSRRHQLAERSGGTLASPGPRRHLPERAAPAKRGSRQYPRLYRCRAQ